MSRVVWKFSIPVYRTARQEFEIPEGAKLLHVAAQTGSDGQVSLWFEVDTDRPREARTFQTFGTGHALPEDAGEYVGTALIPSIVVPELVIHVFERGAGA